MSAAACIVTPGRLASNQIDICKKRQCSSLAPLAPLAKQAEDITMSAAAMRHNKGARRGAPRGLMAVLLASALAPV